MAFQPKVFDGWPSTFALTQPFVAPSPHCMSGVPFSIDLRTGALCLINPWEMKKAKVIHSTLFQLFGQQDMGKSTFLKTLPSRLMALQAPTGGRNEKMRTRNNSRRHEKGKDEYKPTSDRLHGEIYSLSELISINLLDPSLGMREWDMVDLLSNLCEMESASGSLVNHQPTVIMVAVNQMLRNTTEGGANLELFHSIINGLRKAEVDETNKSHIDRMMEKYRSTLGENSERYQKLSELVVRESNITEAEVNSAASLTTTQIGKILYGPYGQLFCGDGSLRSMFTGRHVTLDWVGLNDGARQILESVMWKWSSASLASGMMELIPHINNDDEVNKVITDLMYSRFQTASFVTSRQSPTAHFGSTQFIKQIVRAGEEASEIRTNGETMMEAIGAFFLFQTDEITREVADKWLGSYKMSDNDLEGIKNLKQGQFAFKPKKRPPTFHHYIVLEDELQAVESNSAQYGMTEYTPNITPEDMARIREDTGALVMSNGDLQKHARLYGIQSIGETGESPNGSATVPGAER